MGKPENLPPSTIKETAMNVGNTHKKQNKKAEGPKAAVPEMTTEDAVIDCVIEYGAR